MRCLPMINKHKKFLTAAVFCAIASTGFVLTASAEETMTHDLDEVVVEADKDALPGSADSRHDFAQRFLYSRHQRQRYQFLPKRYPRSNDSICRPDLYDRRHSIYFRP